jgi:hypothetical protein
MHCEFNALMVMLVKQHLDGGKTVDSFSLNTRLGFLRDLTPRCLAKAYNYLLENSDIVTRSWTKAVADVPDGSHQLNLLDAWESDVQDLALEKFAAGTLFPSQQEKELDETEDLFGEMGIDDGGEVSVGNLAAVLSHEGVQPAVLMMTLSKIDNDRKCNTAGLTAANDLSMYFVWESCKYCYWCQKGWTGTCVFFAVMKLPCKKQVENKMKFCPAADYVTTRTHAESAVLPTGRVTHGLTGVI